ncbi:unnamed protein product [Gulo gulo]|uniref:Uncharacterized protein n=1 Tax=Gulo gulo TaxID=48420 RepID=A0A9X9LEJ9_GULGU|nr:unnamed protein product [Gulo gulo]
MSQAESDKAADDAETSRLSQQMMRCHSPTTTKSKQLWSTQTQSSLGCWSSKSDQTGCLESAGRGFRGRCIESLHQQGRRSEEKVWGHRGGSGLISRSWD